MKPVILVTGGAGYIGSHVCQRLTAAGLIPVTLDDLSTGHASAVRFGPLVEGSIEDRAKLVSLRTEYQPIALIHAAALSDAAESVKQPQRYWKVNVAGTAALREVFGDLPMVFSSSAAVYGDGSTDLSEDDAQRPLNPYGASKVECEALLPHSMRLRYFNVSGCAAGIGLGHKPETHVIPRLLRAALNETVFRLHGSGDAIRDFVHVSDVAEANLLALENALLRGRLGRIVNICSGAGHSITDLIQLAAKITQRRIAVTNDPPRAGDPSRVVGCNALARELLGWAPKRDLVEQMQSAWEWISRGAPVRRPQVMATA